MCAAVQGVCILNHIAGDAAGLHFTQALWSTGELQVVQRYCCCLVAVKSVAAVVGQSEGDSVVSSSQSRNIDYTVLI